jgi:hypothetical protein
VNGDGLAATGAGAAGKGAIAGGKEGEGDVAPAAGSVAPGEPCVWAAGTVVGGGGSVPGGVWAAAPAETKKTLAIILDRRGRLLGRGAICNRAIDMAHLSPLALQFSAHGGYSATLGTRR